MITIYHNPRCSKSRDTLALVQTIADEQSLPLHIIDYQKTVPGIADLRAIMAALGTRDVQSILRSNEDEYSSLQLQDADMATALAAIVSHPRLLQRPIVTYQNKAAIGRPPEHVLTLFKKD
ncbi:ArsC/Spx/MgsR family protein [Undibacterium sp. TS12]|uniref:ArsC/Spx/MgsR family protein n=1 Tax=Undibacterium sp. TS12 TaxID=2908202 RepID=UPI001F4C69E6|nr:ArsC/Spx/MgsR family protein [Undibacterium sp. TS12]MCH8617802.1 arsenate reductase (glutaredoxin) [Undibacterium sp. TS12]